MIYLDRIKLSSPLEKINLNTPTSLITIPSTVYGAKKNVIETQDTKYVK